MYLRVRVRVRHEGGGSISVFFPEKSQPMGGRIMAQPTHGPLMYLKFFSEIVYRDTLVQVIYHHELFFCLTN